MCKFFICGFGRFYIIIHNGGNMEKRDYIYVDNSNFWIEGSRFSAVKKGMAKNLREASENGILDKSWRFDFGRLLEFSSTNIGKAVLFGSKPPETDSIWNSAKQKGFEVVALERHKTSHKEKRVDTKICSQIVSDMYELMHEGDEVILYSGDADLTVVKEFLSQKNIKFSICFWSHASNQTKKSADNFIRLDDFFDYFTLN